MIGPTTRLEDWAAYRAAGARIERAIRTRLSALSFWAAILLPFLYVPGLFYGPETSGAVAAVLGLIGLHFAALIGGRNYEPDQEVRGVRPRQGASD